MYHNLYVRCHNTILTSQTLVRAVGVFGSLWKHQQSRDHTFLHRNYTQLFFSTPKNKFSEVDRKKSEKKSKNVKNLNFQWKIIKIIYGFLLKISTFLIFRKFFDFFPNFFHFFFRSTSENLFFGVEKKVEFSFDVTNWDPSIYDVFSTFWAL